MKSRYFLLILPVFLLMACYTNADTVNLSQLSAQGVAIYGWRNGVATALYLKNGKTLFPVASLTKLVTAKAVEELYPENTTFTISPQATTNTGDSTDGMLPGMVLSRDDLLRALLISSNNGAAIQFAQSADPTVFLSTMNTFLHTNQYTTTNFVNVTGLDPTSNKIKPNMLTAESISYLLNNIYTQDPLLTGILEEKNATIIDEKSGTVLTLPSSNEINSNPIYAPEIILSKTGTTQLAGQNLAFMTNGEGQYDYITVVMLHSQNRVTDGELILNWLQQIGQYRP